MQDKDFILNIFLEDFLKVAKVNLITGEYKFIRVLDSLGESACVEAENISEYIKRTVKLHLIHPDDVQEYLEHTDLKYLWNKISQNKLRKVFSYRRKVSDVYAWVTFEITVPQNFSKENPWVVFSWKEADNDTRMMEDALHMLSSIYHKILKVNLTEDTHEDIKVYEEEIASPGYGYASKISKWLWDFANNGNVHEGDLTEYLAFTDLKHLRTEFKKSKNMLRFRYRRKRGNEFRWVMMELIPSIEYTDEKQIVMLYIRDIHDEYISELNYRKELEYYCNYDVLTGIWNRFYYNKFCTSYGGKTSKEAIGVLFADVNGLKYINDTFGHEEGDKYIKTFTQLLITNFGKSSCCRISGDEFVVFFEQIGQTEFFQSVTGFHNLLQKQESPIASVGYAWNEAPDRIEELVQDAEAEMYKDKQEYYKKHPRYARTQKAN